ncbi:MAG: DEAD/DEAH box helicase, partial [Desulfobulbaceae bacterium]|nr:DEAD/DEAH box helicase [Desulfobulbaceae bacterium]
MKRGSVGEYVTALKNSDRFGPQVVEHRFSPEIPPDFAGQSGRLSPEIDLLLDKSTINSLYSHQEKAITHVLAKKNVFVATPTASGKSLIYNLPVFAELIQNPQARALYLFPLKALAQDQVKTINKLGQLLPEHFSTQARIPAAIYDGDTSGYQRKKIRDHLPGILVTNPDMLHLSMLAYHDKWANLFANLTHIIIDEVHTYRGVFGSHMAWVIRRLKRICSLYGSKPVFILSSATIGNPEELAGQLIAAPVEVITNSGAPRAPRNILLLNPLDSAAAAATMLLEAAVHRGLRTIVYTQSRKMTELIAMWADRRLGEFKGKVTSYRAGFLPEDRRDIEQQLVDGSLIGVISTSALELGIDIGNLDICILVGYPGSMMATWQRAGRVGRGRQESLTVLVGHEDALDQYFMRNPGDFFSRDVEPVVLNPGNEMIAGRHLICAAAESPLIHDELLVSQNKVINLLARLTLQGKLLQSADGNTWFSARKYPQRDVDLRGSGTRYRILHKSGRELLGEIDGFRAFKECHPGAIYLHRAQARHVDSLDLETHEIVVSPFKGSYYTRAMTDKTTDILEVNKTVLCGSTRVHFGSLRVTETITGYQKIRIGRQKIIARIPLELPPNIFETQGFWIEIPDRLRQQTEKQNFHFMGGIHAMEHAIIGILPLMVLCDRNDIGGISHPRHEQTEGATVFIYDGYAGGIGLTKKGFSMIQALMEQTKDAVRECPCDIGCPSCIHSPKCGSGNRPIDKQACLSILES